MKNDSKTRDTQVAVRLTSEERSLLEAAAAREHLNVSVWMRSVLMKTVTNKRQVGKQKLDAAA